MLQQREQIPATYKAYTVGLDVSLTSTGVYCHPVGDHEECYGFSVRSTPKDGSDTNRVLSITRSIVDTVNDLPYPVKIIGIEDYGPINRTSGKIAQRAEIVGILKQHFLTEQALLITIAPKALKKFATGNGNASKDMMVAAANKLGYYPATNDEADAMFLALAATDAVLLGKLPINFNRINPI